MAELAVVGRSAFPRASDDVAVRIRGVAREFMLRGQEVKALGPIDLDIRRGEFLCIVGPSGCGKTTLLRILAGLETPTAGNIEIVRTNRDGGRPINSMVFQEQSVFPWMTVVENVGFGLKARGVPKSQRQAISMEYVEKVGLRGFEDALPHQLSGGMKQRVSVARAFANDPEILLMDEPFAALDEQTKIILQAELLRIWEETKKTVIYVTHSIDEAILLADRVVVMTARPGRVKDVVDVAAHFSRPRTVDQVRASAAYGELFRRIWSQLRDEVGSSSQLAARQSTQDRADSRGLDPSAGPAAGGTVGTEQLDGEAPETVRIEPAPAAAKVAASRSTLDRMLYLVSPVALLILWEVLARLNTIDTRFFPAPSSILEVGWQMVRSGELWGHVKISLSRILVGFFLGAAPGVVVGLAMGLLGPVRAILQPVVDATFPIPKIAILPLFIMVFGIGEASKYAIIAVAVVYLVLINTMAGVRNIDKIYLDVGRNYHASRRMMFLDVALPGSLPYIMAGIKLGMGIALIVIVAAEFVGARSGIGYLIWSSWQVFQVSKMYVGLLVTAALGFLVSFGLDELERLIIPWKAGR